MGPPAPAADSHGARLHHHGKGMWPGRNLWSPLPPISFLGNRETGAAAPAEPLNHVPHIESPATVHQASTSTSKEQAVNIAGNHVRCCGDSKAICAGKVLGPNPGKVGVKNPGCTALLFVAMREPLPDNIAFMDHLEALPGAAGVEERLEL